jgi:hypothetical protein
VASGFATPLSLDEADRVLENLETEGKAVIRYQAVLKIRGEGPEGGFSATQVVVFERPDRMRVELLGAFGTTRWVAVASRDEIIVWFPGRREFLRERQVESVIGALVGVDLSPGEVMAALSGTGLPLEGLRPLSALQEDGVTRIDLGGAMVELEGTQVKSARQPGYRVAYPSSWKSGGKQVPDRLEIASDELRASLRVEDLGVNVRLHPEAFVVELPGDARQLGLAQIGDEAVFVRRSR